MITPIETTYKGCRFRSRLEARWAVFFDTLGVKWEYEPQGYLVEGEPYLPDFRLVLAEGVSVFAEVKPQGTEEHEGRHIRLCRALARQSDRNVLLLIGSPSLRMYHQFSPDLGCEAFQCAFFIDDEPKILTADGYWYQKVEMDENTGVLEFRLNDRALSKSLFGKQVPLAIEAARSARFEHGESGAGR